MSTLLGIVLLICAFLVTVLVWVAASLYDESKRIEERTQIALYRRLHDLREFYCPECGELLDPVDPGNNHIEEYYCDCGWYDGWERIDEWKRN